jgi:UDP-galactopyranose mutase
MYDVQTKSKWGREQNKYFDMIFHPDRLYEELNEPYFKTTYAGKPTKRYQKIIQQIRRAESIPRQTVGQLFLPKGCRL